MINLHSLLLLYNPVMEKQFLNKNATLGIVLFLATYREESQLSKPLWNIYWLKIFKFPKGDFDSTYIRTKTVLGN